MNNEDRLERHVVAWVDDDADYRGLVREWLDPRYDVKDYGDGERFLADLARLEPDAIVLDVGLPEMDGFTICAMVRAKGLDVPILFLTSSADQDHYIRHLELGAAGYLMKPIGRAQLLARLAEVIDGERTSRPSPCKEAVGWVPGLRERRLGMSGVPIDR